MAHVHAKTKLTCFDVADYFLSLTDKDAGDLISNLKLQKLVYYAQGYYLAMFDAPLFSEKIEAWAHGPVIPELYSKYSKHRADNIPPLPQEIDFKKFGQETRDFLNEVYCVLGQFSAWKLRSMTHEEPPWENAYAKGDGSVISHEEMKTYFETLVEKEA